MKKILLLLVFTISSSFATPELLHTKTGVPVYFQHSAKPNIVDINILWQAGSAYDGKQFGIAKLTHDLMRAGANGIGATVLLNQIASAGAQLSGSVNRSFSLWHLRSLTDMQHLRPALNTFKMLVSQPNFDKMQLANYKLIQQSAISATYDSPDSLASRALIENIYKGTPLAHSILGTNASLDKITQQDIKKFYKQYYNKNNVKVIIVGAVSNYEATKLAAACIHNLSTGKVAPKIKMITPLRRQTVKVVNYPSKQAHIIFAQTGVTGSNPAYFPLLVSNQSFGSGMTSTLFKEVRDKRGLAYSANSSWLPTPYGGLFVLNLQTKATSAPRAITLVEKLLLDYKNNIPSKKTIKLNQQKINGKLALQQSSNSGLLQQLTNIAANNYPLNYYAVFANKVNNVNRKTIHKALDKYLHPKKMLIIAVKPKRVKLGL